MLRIGSHQPPTVRYDKIESPVFRKAHVNEYLTFATHNWPLVVTGAIVVVLIVADELHRRVRGAAELEPTARGAYCGSLGYLGFDGQMDSSILIRTVTAGQG